MYIWLSKILIFILDIHVLIVPANNASMWFHLIEEYPYRKRYSCLNLKQIEISKKRKLLSLSNIAYKNEVMNRPEIREDFKFMKFTVKIQFINSMLNMKFIFNFQEMCLQFFKSCCFLFETPINNCWYF